MLRDPTVCHMPCYPWESSQVTPCFARWWWNPGSDYRPGLESCNFWNSVWKVWGWWWDLSSWTCPQLGLHSCYSQQRKATLHQWKTAGNSSDSTIEGQTIGQKEGWCQILGHGRWKECPGRAPGLKPQLAIVGAFHPSFQRHHISLV